MKARLARLLRRLADWLDPRPGVSDDLLQAACRAVRAADETPHTSAYKRAIAFKALHAEYPLVPRRDIGLAIELAVREVVPQ